MTFADIISNASSVISAVATDFTALSAAFGGVLAIPAVLVLTKSGIIGGLKSLLMFRRGGRR